MFTVLIPSRIAEVLRSLLFLTSLCSTLAHTVKLFASELTVTLSYDQHSEQENFTIKVAVRQFNEIHNFTSGFIFQQ